MAASASENPGGSDTYRGMDETARDEETSMGYASEGEDGDGYYSDTAVVDWKPARVCTPCFSAKCCCHVCYIVEFCLYIVVFPLWCKYLVTAPMPYDYWGEEWPAFPMIRPIEKTDVAVNSTANPQIVMSSIPTSDSACDYSCSTELYGFQTDEMNFNVDLRLNMSDLVQEQAHTLFPVILTSTDFLHWQLAADRRNAHPQPFFRSRTSGGGSGYQHVTDSCTKQAASSFGLGGTYILACVTWREKRLHDLEDADEVETDQIGEFCDAVGGVCGYPCASSLPASLMTMCSSDGEIDAGAFVKTVLRATSVSTGVRVQACESSDAAMPCYTSTMPLSSWVCHQCEMEVEETDDEGDDEDEGFPDLPGIPGMPKMKPPPGLPPIKRRRLRSAPDPSANRTLRHKFRRLQMDGPTTTPVIYQSLPRMMVTLQDTKAPAGSNVMASPHVVILTATTLDGPWKKLFPSRDLTDPEAPPLPWPIEVGTRSKEAIKASEAAQEKRERMAPDTKSLMWISNLNELSIQPESCFGRRGPLYVVACAVNVSTYTTGLFTQFSLGQAVAPPPFNDRCLAVSGRCGHACISEQPPLPYCMANGYINRSFLVGQIHLQDNKQVPVYMFVYVLLFGFCVKVVMLCPGIFSPYPHCGMYYPELTEQLRYIVTCTPSTAGDENKSTTIRNLVGCISAMPRGVRCRYHVVLLDETHRHEMKVCWQKLCGILTALPTSRLQSYEDTCIQFFAEWCEDTKKLNLNLIGAKVRELEPGVLERVCGKSALKKLRLEPAWASMDPVDMQRFETALTEFEEDIRRDNKWTRIAIHRDDVADWEPKDARCMLRTHYVARAKPIEDERTNRVQHVAPGTWYYKVPADATLEDWLALRQSAKEMAYGHDDEDMDSHVVPLRTSRGKAGGLNFVENYMVVVAERPENAYNNEQDEAPCLYSIADARHQFQHDFMASTIPYFFNRDGDLDTKVAFTQCPQHFHESQDKTDYLDTNNASFFRLNCMIRNCSGGVSSCGTNGTWMIKHRDNSTIWETEKVRVRDRSRRSRKVEVIERRTFHESCKVEDTASSLQAVVAGRHSQFINRKLSYGMAKAAVGYLAATQRWAEGGVVLSLQTLTTCEKGHWMVFATLLCFIAFIFSLIRLVTQDVDTWLVVMLGLVSQETMDIITIPLREFLGLIITDLWRKHMLGTGIKDPDIYTKMALQMVMWLFMLMCCLFVLWVITSFCKLFRRKCCIFPDQLRWCGRLLITMDNLTYFVWFWTAFFWIGFNYYTALTKSHYHFQFEGMMLFMAVVQVLNWGMIISNSFRYSLEQSMEANEIAHLSMDNIWRSNQLFYMTAPVQLFSILVGTKEYLRYQFYGMDISFWEGGDRGDIAISIVKYWTLLLVTGPVFVWTCYFLWSHQYLNAWAASIVVTIIGLDVLHPCAYLWVGDSKLSAQDAAKMSWKQGLLSRAWWARVVNLLVLNRTLTGILKYVGPAYFLLLPLSCLFTTYFGVNAAFMMVATNR